jgi:hypothetical protein
LKNFSRQSISTVTKPKKPRAKSKLIYPTPEKNERINAGIEADPDTWELTFKDIVSMRPMPETLQNVIRKWIAIRSLLLMHQISGKLHPSLSWPAFL